MSAFEDVTLNWDGKNYLIPANRMMGAIARVEGVVTLHELREFAQRGGAPIGKLSMAYGVLLRYAGATITDDEIYLKLMEGRSELSSINAIRNVLLMMIPPSMRKGLEEGTLDAEAIVKKEAEKEEGK